jgi:hypothetical protein
LNSGTTVVEKHIERGYIDFAMAFSLVVELLTSACGSGRPRPRTT